MKSRRIARKTLLATIGFAIVGACLIPIATSALFVGNKRVLDVRLGSTMVNRVYVGGSLVWQRVAYMQDFTSANCAALRRGDIVNLIDRRDNTTYRVKKMVDNNCWMIDNLALDLTTNYTGKPIWTTAPVKLTNGMEYSRTAPQITLANNITGQGQIPNGNSPKASYLYNWCATVGDTSANCSASAGAPEFSTVINGVLDTTGTATSQLDNTGICPAPFRLPKGGPNATSSNPATTANEFAKLDLAMGGEGGSGGGFNATTLSYFSSLSSPDPSGFYFNQMLSGIRQSTTLEKEGTIGYLQTSTGGWSATNYMFVLYYDSTPHFYSVSNTVVKELGVSVRCLISP